MPEIEALMEEVTPLFRDVLGKPDLVLHDIELACLLGFGAHGTMRQSRNFTVISLQKKTLWG